MVLNSRVTLRPFIVAVLQSNTFQCMYSVVYYHFDRFFCFSCASTTHVHFAQSNFQLFGAEKPLLFHKPTWELKSIRLQNYDSTVCTFIDFKLWFTVLNDRYITKSHLMLSKTQGNYSALSLSLCSHDMLPFKSITKCVRVHHRVVEFFLVQLAVNIR